MLQFASSSGKLIRRALGFSIALLIGCGGASPDRSTGVGEPVGADVTFTIDPAVTFAISRFIYGGNFIDDPSAYGGATPPPEMTLNRFGGNRLTAWNWETNHSNAGRDYRFQNDEFLSASGTPGEAVRTRAAPSFARGQAFMATVPMLGHVAGNANGEPLDTADATRATRLSRHFLPSRAAKGAAFSVAPDTRDGVVYQDEFVHWFSRTFPGRETHATAPVFFTLDNEPDIWHSTHKQIQSDSGDRAASPRLQSFAGLSDTSIAYARAIKAVLPEALVFGPAVATYAGVVTAGRYPSPDPQFGAQNFFDVYLDRMRAAHTAGGRRLLDVLDLHWYGASGTSNGEIGNDYAVQDAAMIQKRVQAPRSLWDPTYDEGSWVSGVTGGPIRLLPRLRAQVAAHYPGTKLAITEYYYGRGGDISGGVAQADALGVFGREGLFAAALWPQAQVWAAPWNGDGRKAYAYVFGAFRMFLNYDGSGGRFGDTGVQARSSDVAASSVYASRDASGRLVVVAINKTSTTRVAHIGIAGGFTPGSAGAWVMMHGSPSPTRAAAAPTITGSTVDYSMPSMSVSTLVITP
ncbi:MAG: hypothetical protein IT355_10170 [Gemmatimonadaceae bacterium]|nr:hypothetical protein [Gemmatimonadaceae bacterium]